MQPHPFMLIARWAFPRFYKQFDCLLVQAKMMRSRFKRLHLSEEEKAKILSYYDVLGLEIKPVLVAVSHETLRKWKRERDNPNPKPKRKRGRPPITKELITLVIKIARETGSGYSKITGHLRTLNIWNVSPSSVKNILRRKKLPLAPARDVPWTVRLRAQFSTLIACDFFTHPLWTLHGPVLLYVLFFINLHTRKVEIAGVTRNPDSAWIAAKTKTLSWLSGKVESGMLIRDGDRKFTSEFDEIFKAKNFRVYQIPRDSPNLNAHAESFVDKIKSECLRYFPFVLHEKQIEFIAKEFQTYYNEERPHRANDLLPLSPIEAKSTGTIKRRSRLSGLLNFYYRG